MQPAQSIPYKNPIGDMTNIGDPFILKDGNSYYLYATSVPKSGFKVWKSDNLVDWTDVGMAYDHRTQENIWATGDFWAPEVLRHQGKYVMTFSARNRQGSLRICVAAAEQPVLSHHPMIPAAPPAKAWDKITDKINARSK